MGGGETEFLRKEQERMDIGSFLQFGGRQLKHTLVNLTSLSEQELDILSDSLGSLNPPFGRREIRALGQGLNEKAGRLSGDDWSEVVGVLLQSLGNADFITFLEDSGVIDDKARKRLDTILQAFKEDHPVRRVVDIDRFLEQGPRLTGFTWFCDVRTRFSDRKSTRLNSSHLVISYAVFCLKKKKINMI